MGVAGSSAAHHREGGPVTGASGPLALALASRRSQSGT